MSGHMEDNLDDEVGGEINSPVTPRRAARYRKMPKKYEDFDTSPSKRRLLTKLPSDSSDDEDAVENPTPKPKALFDSDDVEGQDIFKFKSRVLKLGRQNKVHGAINSPSKSTLTTPKRNMYLLNKAEETPKEVKHLLKKRIIKEVESDSTDSDNSGSSSDFEPDKTDDMFKPSKNIENSGIATRSRYNKNKENDSEYIVTPDNYFTMNSSKKITTSDHTLTKLKNMNLNEQLKEVDVYISKEHQGRISDLVQSYKELFDKWLYTLSEDFNIILYGIGSKRTVLHTFQMDKLKHVPCVVINGFFPSLTLKSVLEAIVVELLGNSSVPSNLTDVVNLIDCQLTDSGTHLFLIVHNIDGVMLRNSKAQTMLANISQLKNIHTIATTDHINSPLLWDHTKLSKCKFKWWDVTTFLPFSEETSFEYSLMTQRTAALQLSSLKRVHHSLTTNARKMFHIIMQYQLENQKQNYQGLPLKDLYSLCRERFVVSTELMLRAHLTEFLDHKLVQMKRTLNGSENLVIPIERNLLQQFFEENACVA